MEGLTDEQAVAVARRRGPLLLSAAAGSGKTRVLVERFVAAVREDGISPGQVLAITFTERAAGEMSERLRARFTALGDRELARDVESALVSTFHGFCAVLLRAHARLAGVAQELRVLDEVQSARLRVVAFDAALVEWVRAEAGAAVELLAAYGAERLRTMIDSVHAELRSRGDMEPRIPVAAEGASPGDDGPAAAACRLLDSLLVRFGARYEDEKRQRGALDFDDLELRGARLLSEHRGVRERWRDRFELLMVDELQDVNQRQFGILNALERDNLFTVGDELQSIYGFRHADVRLFTARRAALEERGSALALTHNFRSHEEIVNAVNAIFEERPGHAFTPLVAGRNREDEEAAEPARARSAGEPRVELLLVDEAFRRPGAGGARDGQLARAPLTRQIEARMLARRVRELVEQGVAGAGDVALLLRARTGMQAFAQALREEGLAVDVRGGGFWETEEVGDLLAFLRAVANPLDEEGLYGVMRSPLAGASLGAVGVIAGRRREAWASIGELAELPGTDAGGPAWAEALDARDRERLAALHTALSAARTRAAWLGVGGLLREMVTGTDHGRYLESLPDAAQRRANVRKLVRLALDVERDDGPGLRRFLDRVEYLREAGPGGEEEQAPPDGGETDAVRVMTIHAAKGLEFPVVCVADLGARPPGKPADLLVDGERVGVRLKRAGVPETTPALAYGELEQERRSAQEAEEDRILYVALTRARERLLLSGVAPLARWPEVKAGCPPLRWLAPTLVEDLAERLAAAAAGAGAGGAAGAAAPGRDGGDSVEGGDAGAMVGERVMGRAGPLRLWLHTPAAPQPLAVARGHASAPDLQPHRPPGAAVGAAAGRAAEALAADALRAAADGPHEAVFPLTYTALTKLSACGYRYYLEDVLRLPELDRDAPGPGSGEGRAGRGAGAGGSPRERGRLVHAIMERVDFAAGDIPADAVPRDLVTDAGGPAGGELDALVELARAAARSDLGVRLGGLELLREQPFAFAIEGEEALVTGAMDVYARLPGGGALIVDYKSDRVSAAEDLAGLVERDYAIQRLVYALAALRAGAERAEVAHWFLARPRDVVLTSFEAAQADALERELRGLVARARERGYAVSAEPHRELCAGCPGRGGLCSWSEEETARPGAGG
ncbi:MAG: UvrD-helicase domain-containing protein [Acidobacteriota bacterium]|nr:UvrD-helicase domain-containing protein [Acidobacteriota bacterium]